LRNIELKARLTDLGAAREVAEAVATQRLAVQHQVDTYFPCRQGRLKLRQTEGRSAQLVWYARADEPGPKPSRYVLVPVSHPETLKAALTAGFGVYCVVRKRREIFLYHNVRIHLDEVEGLGPFLEFEAVIGPDDDEATGYGRLEALARRFSVAAGQMVSGSYADMLC